MTDTMRERFADLCIVYSRDGLDAAVSLLGEIHFAEIEAAREEGRRAGMMEAAQIVCGKANRWGTGTDDAINAALNDAASAIEAKAKED